MFKHFNFIFILGDISLSSKIKITGTIGWQCWKIFIDSVYYKYQFYFFTSLEPRSRPCFSPNSSLGLILWLVCRAHSAWTSRYMLFSAAPPTISPYMFAFRCLHSNYQLYSSIISCLTPAWEWFLRNVLSNCRWLLFFRISQCQQLTIPS